MHYQTRKLISNGNHSYLEQISFDWIGVFCSLFIVGVEIPLFLLYLVKMPGDWVSADTSATVTYEIETTGSNADGWIITDEGWMVSQDLWVSSLISEETYEQREEKVQKWRTKMQGMYNKKSNKYNPVRHFTDIWNG